MQTVKLAALVKQRRLRRVEVLGLALVQHASTETDQPAAMVVDWKHHPITEAVVEAAAVFLHQQAGPQQCFTNTVIRPHSLQQRIPTVWRETQTKIGSDFARESAALQVINGLLGLGMLAQHAPVEEVGQAETVEQRGADVRLVVRSKGCALRHLDPGALRQVAHRLGETHVLIIHEKANGAAMHAAAKAMEKLLVLADGERGGFFLVEGAIGLVVLAGLFERHARVDHVHDVDSRQQIVNELLRDFARHGVILARPGCDARRDWRSPELQRQRV